MKTIRNILSILLVNCLPLFTGIAFSQDSNPCPEGSKTRYYGVEINGTLCGYSVENQCIGFYNGKPVNYENSTVILKMTALGAGLDVMIKSLYGIDPVTEKAHVIKYTIQNGQSVIITETIINNDSAFFTSSSSGVPRPIPLGKDAIISSTTWNPHLKRDFIKGVSKEQKYSVYDPMKGELVEKVYVRKREEELRLADSVFQTLVLEETDLSTGLNTTLWLNKADGFNLKVNVANRNIYLANKSVKDRISIFDMNNQIFAKVNKVIPDVMNLTGMKVKAKIDSYGETLTSESLNLPDQKFSGTVSGSLIEGTFELNPVKYSGTNAPPFPPDFSKNKELKKYLDPELVIESDDPVIIAEAKKITAGAENSWKAAVRLSKWVAENIAGAIPGGISAINTLKTREAECGGHSRLLTAFCRAVGIPARLVVGCMYTTYYGGGFGQHAWTEVYMGSAGWIPVDATIGENEFVDAGHIRLGEKATFQPQSMEIIDFQIGSKTITNEREIVPDVYKSFVGKYTDMGALKVFKIQYNEGGLSVDIPGQMVLSLNEPDSLGQWYPKMSRQISFSFGQYQAGKAEKMFIRQIAPLTRVSSPDSVSSNVPTEFRKYLGNYTFSPAKISFDVSYTDGFIISQDPLRKIKGPVKLTDKGGYWTDNEKNYEIRFDTNQDNQVTGIKLTVITTLVRGEPVSVIIEPAIEASGIAAGIKKYEEIRDASTGEYLFTDVVLNRLGHQLLSKGRMDDALEIFKLNVKENPGSFLANDSLAETYLKKGENKLARQYFIESVKLNPEYDYGKKMIEELKTKK